jgi:hypothetical protein
VHIVQHDVDFQNLVIALHLKPHLDVVGVDRKVFGNHRDQVLSVNREQTTVFLRMSLSVENFLLELFRANGRFNFILAIASS